jgi:kumamolisin
MAPPRYLPFAASHRDAPSGTRMAAVPDGEAMEISLYLKPRLSPAGFMSRAAMLAHRTDAHKDDIALVQTFAAEAGLAVVAVEPARRLIRLSGTAAAMQAAFKTTLHHYHDGKTTFRGRSGALSLPEDLEPIVEAVLGLDTRPAAKPRLVFQPRDAQTGASYRPNAVAGFYGFPTDVTGAGECIALIELGGGYTEADTQAAFSAMGLTPPTVIAVPVDGGANAPTPDTGADGEVALDIQVAGGAAPGAKIAVYFSTNTDAGFVDAVTAATADAANKPSVMSISWGSAESTWSAQGQSAMTSALRDAATAGISVFVAAGDNLATDGVTDSHAHVDFPASSPWAIGCGGTNITVENGAITAERVWNNQTSGTGGGVSAVYPVPAFQAHANVPKSVNKGHAAGRGVPDVAGNADPASGYIVVVGGQPQIVGGTSAVAPLWAGLTALINQQTGAPAGFFLPALYANPAILRDITTGNNKPEGSKLGYNAGPGYDCCTGLGVPTGKLPEIGTT